MKVDIMRIKRLLSEIVKNSEDLKKMVEENTLRPDSIKLKAVKYILIEWAEAISNTLQHILAREWGIPVSGYIDTIVKGKKEGIISAELFQKLKPFFDFRISLINRYWIIDEDKLIENIKSGKNDFVQFIDEVEAYVRKLNKNGVNN